ncbi:recombinase family protein [Comamonas terrigena]|uniref:recombinase family protein n=1 Tax=Comamonas terrigena TaxID=32013 RepID=UPI00244B8532|nr:recombinase family protein [Comamonas terrigena]MDH0049250.1 recombinase family protein [Comamonas terrigena]MDH0511961.1 recombinase family protein [Comamonas terrigena]MDH1091661.1 recombinase family protein [Comamonas terrigena]
MENNQEQRPIAYSYVRFSTTKQELGDSLRRQVQMAQDYCAEHNLDLHQDTYRDLGVSAFKRKNLEKGALASFIEGVKSGKVPRGSYLVIEQFDRMSRAETSTALRLLLDLVKSGIKVVTLSDRKVWDSDSINDTGNLVLAIVYMSRANNESQAKADRLSSIWSQKKKRAADGTAQRIVTSECPRWLRPNSDKTGFVVLEDKVESIKKVFAMRIAGHGIVSIMRRANQEQWPVPGKSAVQKSGESQADFKARAERTGVVWHESLVGRLLKNRALLGEYLPHKNHPEDDSRRIPEIEPIAGYYPAVLDEETFLRAQAKADRSGRFPGRRDASLKNWLQGLLRCTCGNSFVRKNKDSQAQPGYARYYCSARNRGLSRSDGSMCPGANARELETAVLYVVSTVAPAFFEGTARIDELKGRLELLEVEVSAARSTHERFLEAIALSPASVKSLTPRLEAAAKALEDREREMLSARAELADLSGDTDTVFENIVKAIQSVDSLDARAALREDLSRIIDKVVVHEPAGYVQVHLRGQDNPVVHPLRKDAQLPTAQGGLQLGQMTEEEHAKLFPEAYR